jgi:SAM-dependent methyltransferase
MSSLAASRYFAPLLDFYARSPSIAVCRVAVLELLASLRLDGAKVLDHCCGDGYIASLAYPGRRLDAGVDLNARYLAAARARGNYDRLECADASRRLPFDAESFDVVLNNSAIEHIPDLDGVLAEIVRVLRPRGRLHFNVLNTRFFDWWPLPPATLAAYRQFQPFYHAFDETGWSAVLERHGFRDVSFRDYFPRAAATVLADYDYRYSAFYLRRRPSPGVIAAALAPRSLLVSRWARHFGGLEWAAEPGQGAGFLVSAVRTSG